MEKKKELKARMISELSVDTLNMLIDFEYSRAGQEDFDDQRLEDDYTNLISEIVHEIIHKQNDRRFVMTATEHNLLQN